MFATGMIFCFLELVFSRAQIVTHTAFTIVQEVEKSLFFAFDTGFFKFILKFSDLLVRFGFFCTGKTAASGMIFCFLELVFCAFRIITHGAFTIAQQRLEFLLLFRTFGEAVFQFYFQLPYFF